MPSNSFFLTRRRAFNSNHKDLAPFDGPAGRRLLDVQALGSLRDAWQGVILVVCSCMHLWLKRNQIPISWSWHSRDSRFHRRISCLLRHWRRARGFTAVETAQSRGVYGVPAGKPVEMAAPNRNSNEGLSGTINCLDICFMAAMARRG